MQCNIDQRGRTARLIFGLLLDLLGTAVLVLAFTGVLPSVIPGVWWMYLIGALLMALGAFAIFESRVGWCAARALGIKTPM